jgi:hypothetical protein
MQIRGAKWWLLFRDEYGHLVQRNSGTADADEARRLLAKAALRVLEARAKEIRRVAYGGETKAETRSQAGKHHGAQPVDRSARLGTRRRSVRGNSASSTKPKANQ